MEEERQALRKKVQELEADVAQPASFYIKKKGNIISMAARECMAKVVAEQDVSLAKAYDTCATGWRMMAQQTGVPLVGDIDTDDAKAHAAISSVAMKGRLAQYVTAWEFAAVVSADGREMRGAGLEWCREERSDAGSDPLGDDDNFTLTCVLRRRMVELLAAFPLSLPLPLLS